MAQLHLQTLEQALQWLRQWVPLSASGAALRTDSRQLQPGDVFLAWPGRSFDGRDHVGAALQADASACLVEADGAMEFSDARVAGLSHLKARAGALADAWYAQPSAHLQVLAVTGTNGKTSTTWWLAQALSALGQKCAVIGTLGIGQPPGAGDAAVPALMNTGLTTPDAVTLHAALHSLRRQGFVACALEASSIGLVEGRLNALHIDVALFTNFTQDHLDHHGDMAAYWAAKRMLFGWPGLRAAVVNIDDEHGQKLAQDLGGQQAQALDLWTVSLHQPARLRATNLRYEAAGLAMEVVETSATGAPAAASPVASGPVTLRCALVGDFNASNALGVLAGLRACGVTLPDAVAAVAGVTPVPGRLQRVYGAGLELVVDYAHTPDALEKALQALRPLAQARGGRLWCVVGCGGNRDASKRPQMGAIAAQRADEVVVTSDNPRDEDPAAIAAQINAGIAALGAQQGLAQRAVTLLDRREAIQDALRRASAGDVILLAGKGHETTQEIRGQKLPFSDIEEARAALAQRAGAAASVGTNRAVTTC